MNNDDLNLHSMTKLSGWLRYCYNIVDIIMFEITNNFGRISTSILDKQRNEVANLAKYVHIDISVTKY